MRTWAREAPRIKNNGQQAFRIDSACHSGQAAGQASPWAGNPLAWHGPIQAALTCEAQPAQAKQFRTAGRSTRLPAKETSQFDIHDPTGRRPNGQGPDPLPNHIGFPYNVMVL